MKSVPIADNKISIHLERIILNNISHDLSCEIRDCLIPETSLQNLLNYIF